MNDTLPAVEIQNLSKQYLPFRRRRGESEQAGGGPVDALRDVSFSIGQGEIFALLGPNGAGKTTLIGCIAGLVTPTSGSARVLGHDVHRNYRQARRLVGLVPQEINFDPFFTVEESMRFQAGYFGVKLEESKLTEILDALGLTSKRHAGTRQLSGGMKRRLLIGKALVHEPRVLFLDEPTAGVDVELRRALWSYVRKLRERGTTIVLTTHYLEEAEELADRIGLIDHGRLLMVARKEEMMARFGQRTVRLLLANPVSLVPPTLASRGAKLAEGGASLELEMPASEELGPVLEDAVAAGIRVRDIETERSGLEEIYVELLGRGRGGEQ